jgi:hypothetical protein
LVDNFISVNVAKLQLQRFSRQKTSQGPALPRSYENQNFSAVTDDNGVKVQWRLLDLLFLNVA